MISRLTILLSVLLLVGCQQQQVADPLLDPSEIRLTSGVWGVVVSKGTVVDGERFGATVCGWEGVSATVDWAQTPTWVSQSEVLAGSTSAAMDLTPARLYDGKGLITVVRAWHPAGVLDGGKVSFENPAGELDVLLAGAVSGNLSQPISASLLFSHLTTQFRFVLQGQWFVEEPIVSIKVKGMRLPVGLDLVSGALIAAAAGDIAVPGVAEGGVLPTQAGVVFGRGLMVVPIEGNKLYVDITTPRKSYLDVEVTTTDLQFTAGRAYTVTLTFGGERHIVVGSQVGDWPDNGHSHSDLT